MSPSRSVIALLLTAALAACGDAVDEPPTGQATAPPPLPEDAPDACVLTPPLEPMACTMQHDPVCGCDGKTYGNACMARGAGVPRFSPGACEEQAPLD